jgi:hypothetical protein
MGQIDGAVLVSAIFVALLVILSFRRSLLDALIEGINNFRGGPPTPMHPSPADDGALLRRRSPKNTNYPAKCPPKNDSLQKHCRGL